MELPILIFLLVLLILFSGFLSGTETAFFSLPSFTFRSYGKSKDSKKRLIFHLLQNPRGLLVTIMMLNVGANILVQNVISSIFEEKAGWIFKVVFPLILTLLFGEIIPKSLALPNNTAIARIAAPYIGKIASFLGPIRHFLTELTSYISRFLFFFLRKERSLSLEELEGVLQDSEMKGIMEKEEVELIQGYLDLRNASVKELMRPKEEILYYNWQEPLSNLEDFLIHKECSRVPVCDGGLENVVGIVSTKRYLFSGISIKTAKDLRRIVKKPFYVPESTSAWSLFQDLREKGESLALVVNEYGSIIGLVTQEDLVEAVIGEIQDQRDPEKKYTKSEENVVIASGKLEIAELEDIFSVSLKKDSSSVTIGGWLIEQLGDIPKAGTKYVTDLFLFYILAAEPNRITRVYIRYLKPKKKDTSK